MIEKEKDLGPNLWHKVKGGWIKRFDRSRPKAQCPLILVPVLVYLLVFFVYPLLRVLLISVFDPSFTLKHYLHALSTAIYLKVMLNTFKISASVTFFCLIMGYPVSYLLSHSSIRIRNLLMIFVIIPLWTSLLVRTYAWMVLLQREGIINQILIKLGIINEPVNIIYNFIGVNVGMINALLPFMILPIYSVMRSIDSNLIEAAQNLGASPLRAFRKIFFPLSLPGVGAGCFFVFALSMGFFVTPALLGGRKETMIAMIIENQINYLLNWGFGSSLAVLLFVFIIILFSVGNKLCGIDRIWGGTR